MSGLALEGVVVRWPDGERAVAGVDLVLPPGELVALCGPNGAGKSTLLAAAAGLVDVSAGSVRLDGRELGEYAPRERARRVALVPQGLDRWPETTVARFVATGRYAHRGWREGVPAEDEPAIARALDLARVTDLADRRVDRVSGGQRQRALVARALAQDAGTLLVDEPTTALDPEHQLGVLEVLHAAAAGGRAVLFVTHELHLAVQFAERSIVLERGRVVADGPTSELVASDVFARVWGPGLGWATLSLEHGALRVPLPRRRPQDGAPGANA